jgi:hypothetical protein
VDNTADVDKPVSTAQQDALDLKADKSPANVGIVGTYAFVIKATAGSVPAGTTALGSDLAYSNAANGIGDVIGVGTWRAMGEISNTAASLAIRVS